MDKTAITTKLEKLEGDSVKLDVTVTSADVKQRVAAEYKEMAKKYRIPGFRPGKAPRPVLDNAIGKDAILGSATDKLLNETYLYVIDSNGLRALGEPDVDADGLLKEGEDFSYSMTIAVKPELDLSSYDPVEIEMPPAEATDEEVEQQLEVLRSYQYNFEDVKPRAIKEGDYLILDMKGVDADGDEVSRYCNPERMWQIGNGLLPAEFDEQLVGMKPGENKKFTIDKQKGFDEGPIAFDVTVVKIREKVFLPLDDAFAVKCGADDLADLKAKIKTSIETQKSMELPRYKESQVSFAIAERLVGEPSEKLIDETKGDLVRRFFGQLSDNGVTFDQWLAESGMSVDQFQEDLGKQALDSASSSLALDALARHMELELTDEDIDDKFRESGVDDPATYRKQWEESFHTAELREAMLREKAMDWLLETAKVTEVASTSTDDSAEKLAAKKPAAKKTAAKKPAAKKTTAAKAADDKPAAEKPAAKKPAATKAAADKKPAAAKKTAAKKPAPKKAPEDDK